VPEFVGFQFQLDVTPVLIKCIHTSHILIIIMYRWRDWHFSLDFPVNSTIFIGLGWVPMFHSNITHRLISIGEQVYWSLIIPRHKAYIITRGITYEARLLLQLGFLPFPDDNITT
jgi:hypothetical protein